MGSIQKFAECLAYLRRFETGCAGDLPTVKLIARAVGAEEDQASSAWKNANDMARGYGIYKALPSIRNIIMKEHL